MRKRNRIENELAEWVESHEGKAAIRAHHETNRGTVQKGWAYEMLEAAGQMSVPLSLRMPAADLAKARSIAQRKGLPYQTYIEMLLHEALTAAE